MKVEIWSDVLCPFCYIGKRRFEKALAQYENRDSVEVTWKSFQLDPSTVTDPSKTVHQYLAARKGISETEALQMNEHVTRMAAAEGLEYHFGKAVVANSFDAHRLSHFALAHGKQDEVEELLFKAYFTEGRNTADHDVLLQIGMQAGLKEEEIRAMLSSGEFADAVRADMDEAVQIGIRGVPFFVFDRKYAISGAQESETFLQGLQQTAAKSG
jgi:predicted DsbA family dithiol-disulfide isomerase